MASEDCGNLRYFDTNQSQFVDQCEADLAAPNFDPNCALVGCIGNTNPSFIQYPQTEAMITAVFWFVFGMLAYPLNLQLLQRCYISKTETSLKTVLFSLLVAAVIAYPPGIYLGIAHAAFGPEVGTGHAFFGMMAFFESQGGWRRIFMTVTTCSYLAAVMSTTDSVIVAVASTVSQDLVKGILSPEMKAEQVVLVGLVVSV